MKISTLRLLLVLLDLMLFASVVGVVWQGLKEKEQRKSDAAKFRTVLDQDLEQIRPEAGVLQQVPYGQNIHKLKPWGVDVAKPEPVAAAVEQPKSARPELGTLVKVMGIQHGSSPEFSFALLLKKGGPPPKPDELGDLFYGVRQVVEFAEGAMVARIETEQVVFDYDGKEVAIKPEAPTVPGAAAPAPAPGTAPGVQAGQVTEDPGTWIYWDPQKPGTITITPNGHVSMKAKGDAVIEGVRWSSETLPDGKPAVKIDHIPDNNVIGKGQAQVGDVIESINGHRVTSKADIIDYVKKNSNLTQYKVRFWRQGRVHERVVIPPRN